MRKIINLIKLIEASTGKRVVLKEEESATVKMTSNQFQKNLDKVKEMNRNGIDIELSDLKEDEVIDEDTLEEFPEHCGIEDLKKFVKEKLPLFDEDKPGDIQESINKTIVDVDIYDFIKKIGADNDEQWDVVKKKIEGAWSKLKQDKIIIPAVEKH